MMQPNNNEVERDGEVSQNTAYLSPKSDGLSALGGELSQSNATATHLTDGNVQATKSEEKRTDGVDTEELTEQTGAEETQSAEADAEEPRPYEKEEATDSADEAVSTEMPAENTEAEAHGQDTAPQVSATSAEQKEDTKPDGTKATDTADVSELDALIGLFPMLMRVKRLEDVPEYARYKELRELGLGISEAFCASNADLFAREQARRREAELKSHLHPLVSTSTAARPLLSESQRRFARATLGGDISDEELDRLWCKIAPQQKI